MTKYYNDNLIFRLFQPANLARMELIPVAHGTTWMENLSRTFPGLFYRVAPWSAFSEEYSRRGILGPRIVSADITGSALVQLLLDRGVQLVLPSDLYGSSRAYVRRLAAALLNVRRIITATLAADPTFAESMVALMAAEAAARNAAAISYAVLDAAGDNSLDAKYALDDAKDAAEKVPADAAEATEAAAATVAAATAALAVAEAKKAAMLAQHRADAKALQVAETAVRVRFRDAVAPAYAQAVARADARRHARFAERVAARAAEDYAEALAEDIAAWDIPPIHPTGL